VGGVYQGLGDKPPLTAVFQRKTDRIGRTTLQHRVHDFKSRPSTLECIRYPPKCAFSRVSNEKFSGEGTYEKENWYPPTFLDKVTPLAKLHTSNLAYGCTWTISPKRGQIQIQKRGAA